MTADNERGQDTIMVNSAYAKRNSFNANRVLRWATIPALVYAAVMLLGLLLWPTAPGVFASGTTLAGRWLSALNGLFTIGVALFIMRRVPDNACGPLLLLWGLGVLGWSQPIEWGSLIFSTVMSMLWVFYLFGVAFPALAWLLYLFPTGYLKPPWLVRPLVLMTIVIVVLATLPLRAFEPLTQFGPDAPANPLYSPFLGQLLNQITFTLLLASLLLLLSAVGSLVWRFRHAEYRERQQIKFLGFGFSAIVVSALLTVVLFGSEVDLGSPFERAWSIVSYMAWQALPASILAITIARYKLWDIDLVIRRTVSYAILTGLLLLVYFGSIVILQHLVTPLTGNSTPATVLSTLLIAALFFPLRRRVQDLIDRRFYRRKYNAAKVLQGFAATARDETDLDQLTAELARVIQETMEPESVTVWLMPASDE